MESLVPACAVVGSVGDATEAQQTLHHHSPSVLVLVLDPPPRNCVAEKACTALIGEHPDIRTLVLLREARPAHIRLACREGARGLLPTDVEPTTLDRVVAQIVAGEFVIHPPFIAHLMASDRPGLSWSPATQSLTRNQTRALTLVSQGRTSKEIAVALGTTTTAIDHTIERASQRLGAAHRAHAVAEALRLGLLT